MKPYCETIYDNYGIGIGVYTGQAGPEDRRRAQVSVGTERVTMTYAEFCEMVAKLWLSVQGKVVIHGGTGGSIEISTDGATATFPGGTGGSMTLGVGATFNLVAGQGITTTLHTP